MQNSRIAFALGGLAGNNAHGAGVLKAALTCRVEPCLISCTSGQIYWTCQYLLARKNPRLDLRKVLEEDIEKVAPTKNMNIDTAILAVQGRSGYFKPAYTDYFQDLCRNTFESFMHVMRPRKDMFLLEECLKTIPARTMIPEFPESFFEEISNTLNESDIGIIFNSYNPVEGKEYVCLNSAARRILTMNAKEPASKRKYDRGTRDLHRSRITYQDITPDAVRDGLWIYQYGFDQKESPFLDGAYFRQILLSELTYARKIYVARPINHKWIGPLPLNYPAMEDLKTEVNFNGTYQGERNQIQLVNKLVKDGAVPENKYHHIDLEEIEIIHQRGYFGYMSESLEVFDHAYNDALGRFMNPISTNPSYANAAIPGAVNSAKHAPSRQASPAGAPSGPARRGAAVRTRRSS